MSNLFIPQWASVIELRDQAALVDVRDGFKDKRQALLFVSDDGRQLMVHWLGDDADKRNEAGRAAINEGAACPADVRAVTGLTA